MDSVVLSKISKVYRLNPQLGFPALQDIRLRIKKGEFVAIVGPSGSGKSTLMHILGLLDTQTAGTYYLDGVDTSQLSEDARARIRNQKIGFVFQNFNLLPKTSALQNVALPLLYAGLSRAEREQRSEQILALVGLGDKLNSNPNQLSGGQQQRVAIARALVNNPEIILADEPTGNLDSKTGVEIIQQFKKLNSSGKTVIIITHSPEVARQVDRVVRLKDGRID